MNGAALELLTVLCVRNNEDCSQNMNKLVCERNYRLFAKNEQHYKDCLQKLNKIVCERNYKVCLQKNEQELQRLFAKHEQDYL